MWSTSAGGHLMKVVNLTGFTVIVFQIPCNASFTIVNKSVVVTGNRS